MSSLKNFGNRTLFNTILVTKELLLRNSLFKQDWKTVYSGRVATYVAVKDRLIGINMCEQQKFTLYEKTDYFIKIIPFHFHFLSIFKGRPMKRWVKDIINLERKIWIELAQNSKECRKKGEGLCPAVA